MRKILLFAILACAILAGCKKSNNEPTSEKKVGACYFKVEFDDFMNARAHFIVYEDGKEVALLNNANPEYLKDGIDLSKETVIEAKLKISDEAEAPTDKYDIDSYIYSGAAVATGTSAAESINIHCEHLSVKGHKADTYEKHMSQLEGIYHYKYRFVSNSVTEVNDYIDD